MFEREKLLANASKKLPFPDKGEENPRTQMDHFGAEMCSGTWIGIWLNMQHGEIQDKKQDCKKVVSEKSGAEQERCEASFLWASSANKGVSAKYKGLWQECNADETYEFTGVSVQEVYVFLLQEEDWLAEVRRPEKLKAGKAYHQPLLANEEHPTYLFTVVFDKAGNIASLEAVYGSEGFSYSYTLKTSKDKKGCTLTIKNECVL